jgi:hypothetical protein
MDATNYFDLEDFNFYGSDRFAFKSLKNLPSETRFRQKSKYGPKSMIWIAIGSVGHCQPYFHQIKGADNADLYAKGCLSKRLIPWVRKVWELLWQSKCIILAWSCELSLRSNIITNARGRWNRLRWKGTESTKLFTIKAHRGFLG